MQCLKSGVEADNQGMDAARNGFVRGTLRVARREEVDEAVKLPWSVSCRESEVRHAWLTSQ
jgi:hypothetical protein